MRAVNCCRRKARATCSEKHFSSSNVCHQESENVCDLIGRQALSVPQTVVFRGGPVTTVLARQLLLSMGNAVKQAEELRLLAKIQAHDESVWNMSVHSKLPILATCSSDRTSKIYDISVLENVKLTTVLDEQTHTKTIRCVSFKPSSEEAYPTLALGSFDSTCSIWGADSFKSEWELLAVIEGHENEVKSIDWSLDGRYLATCARDKTIWIWETDSMNEEFECIAVLSEHEGDVKFVKWNDKGEDTHVFVSCSYDDTLRIWRQDEYDEDEWNCVAMINLENTVWGAAWVDNDTIVCCCDDGKVLVYESDRKRVLTEADKAEAEQGQDKDDQETTDSSKKLPSTIKKIETWSASSAFGKVSRMHEGTVYSVDSRGGRIVSGGSDGCVYVYEREAAGPESGEWRVCASHSLCHGVREVNSVRFVRDNTVASGGDDGSVAVWGLT